MVIRRRIGVWSQESRLLLIIVIVGAGQKVPKDELWHIHTLLLVHLHWNAIPIVPDADCVADLQHQKVCLKLSSARHHADCSMQPMTYT